MAAQGAGFVKDIEGNQALAKVVKKKSGPQPFQVVVGLGAAKLACQGD